MISDRLRRRARGQAAVEAMFAIPVMLLLFAIGCQLWNITYNAQYAHVKARSKLVESVDHMPCEVGDGRGVRALNTTERDTASATTDENSFYGGRFIPTARSREMKAQAVIKCRKP